MLPLSLSVCVCVCVAGGGSVSGSVTAIAAGASATVLRTNNGGVTWTSLSAAIQVHTLSTSTSISLSTHPINIFYQPTLYYPFPLPPITPSLTPPLTFWFPHLESNQRGTRGDQQLQIPLLLHAFPSGALRRSEQWGHHSIYRWYVALIFSHPSWS